jgi:hypothetical protein
VSALFKLFLQNIFIATSSRRRRIKLLSYLSPSINSHQPCLCVFLLSLVEKFVLVICHSNLRVGEDSGQGLFELV